MNIRRIFHHLVKEMAEEHGTRVTAQELGLSLYQVQTYISGKRKPTITTVHRCLHLRPHLAQALGIVDPRPREVWQILLLYSLQFPTLAKAAEAIGWRSNNLGQAITSQQKSMRKATKQRLLSARPNDPILALLKDCLPEHHQTTKPIDCRQCNLLETCRQQVRQGGPCLCEKEEETCHRVLS